MNIAVIGTGNVGAGLAFVLGKTQHNVVVADREGGTEAAKKLGTEGVTVEAANIATAVKNADTVILATPYEAAAEIAKIANFEGKLVIDVSNPVTADFSGLLVGHTSSAAEEISKLLNSATVVKAFNTVFAEHYASHGKLSGQSIQTFVAADNEKAREAVKAIAEEAGFKARDAGPLKNARYLEPLGFMNIQFGYVLGQGVGIAPQWLAA